MPFLSFFFYEQNQNSDFEFREFRDRINKNEKMSVGAFRRSVKGKYQVLNNHHSPLTCDIFVVVLGGGGHYHYPKHVWTPSGGWWPKYALINNIYNNNIIIV